MQNFLQPQSHDGSTDDRETADQVARRLAAVARLAVNLDPDASRTIALQERNRWTRFIDRLTQAARQYLAPIHWMGAASLATALFLYARLAALTIRLKAIGVVSWPDIPRGCVLALWHGSAPSLLVAIAALRPRPRVAIMVARDARGDASAILCKLLGFDVVRGHSGNRGWSAIRKLAQEATRGACVVLTADGGGPAGVAKIGAVVLASVAGVPLFTVAADCRPAVFERHKWDRARNPIPFGRIAVVVHEALRWSDFASAADIEAARRRLQDSLNAATASATALLSQRTGAVADVHPGQR